MEIGEMKTEEEQERKITETNMEIMTSDIEINLIETTKDFTEGDLLEEKSTVEAVPETITKDLDQELDQGLNQFKQDL